MKERLDALIVGAGLAGLSCAWQLVKAGYRVVVLERKPFPGGRTASWIEDGMEVESGLHRVIGFYRALPDLLSQAGLDLRSTVAWEDELEIRLPDGGPRGVFGAGPLTRPLKTLGGALGNNSLLSPRDKLTFAKFAAGGLLDYKVIPELLDRIDIVEYARRKGLAPAVLRRIVPALSTGILFLAPERYSAYAFFGLLGPYLPRLHAMRVGAFKGGMTDVMARPLSEAIAARGGKVVVSSGAGRVLVEGSRVIGVDCAGRRYLAASTIIATGLGPAQRLLGDAFGGDRRLAGLMRLPSMPAVTAQIELAEPSMPVDRTTFSPGTCMASYSEQSRTTFRRCAGRLSIILGPSEDFISMSEKSIRRRVEYDAARLGVSLKGIRGFRVVAENDDFYAVSPGTEGLRPPQDPGIPGLFLAGDYTRQPYLATMEGAVVSGRLAAQACLRNTKPAFRRVRSYHFSS